MTTVGLLSPGELGTVLARILRARDLRVVATLTERSARTRALSRDAGVEDLPSLADLARVAGLVISVARPGHAEAIADDYLAAGGNAVRGRTFVDMNSISPATAGRIAARMARAGVDFVDAALVGPATRVGVDATLYFSGRSAEAIARLFGPTVKTNVLGARGDEASALKMLLGGLNKGLASVFIELAAAAARMDMLPLLLREYRENYPGPAALVERMVPTYARHAARRGEELGEVEAMVQTLGLDPAMVRSARLSTEALSHLSFPPDASLAEFVNRVAEADRETDPLIEAARA